MALRVAWFRAAPPDASAPLDETAPIIARLRRAHRVDVVTEAEAHDFVWMHFRHPYDVCVYELGRAPAHAFMRAYLSHYPGVIAPRGLGVGPIAMPQSPPDVRATSHPKGLRVGVLDAERVDVVRRAAERAGANGSRVEVLTGAPADVLREADAICAVEWPPLGGAPTAALLAMAAGRPAIVLEVEGTAGWAALDPQTWRPRGFDDRTPIAVSVDPRDEEHSLMLAMVRLAADARLRAALGAAGHDWWRTHADVAHATEAWERLLADAAAAPAAATGAADHSDYLRAVLEQFGVTVDLFARES